MFGYLDFLFLQYGGRIGRVAFWLGSLAIGLAQIGATALLMQMAHATTPEDIRTYYHTGQDVLMHLLLPIMIVYVMALYPTYAIYTKRWHDRGKSGWWSLLAFVPIIGLWVIIECGFLGGDEYENAYGTR